MQKQKPIIDQSLSDRADDRNQHEGAKTAATLATWLVNIGILISAVLTTIYIMLLVESATGLPSPFGWIFGLLVGIVAIIPAEMALMVWMIRLRSDNQITGGQRWTAVAAMLFAGVFSALTTSSFFSYFLPQLFPPSYLAIAPTLNVGAIVGSWIVFIMSIVLYGIFSRQTKQNLSEAAAYQSIFDARMTVLKSAGEAIRTAADGILTQMDADGVFSHDARNLILSSLGMDEERMLPAPKPATTKNQEEDRIRKSLASPQSSRDYKRPYRPTAVGMAAETNPAPATLEGVNGTIDHARGQIMYDGHIATPEELAKIISAANFQQARNGQNGQGK